MRTKLLVVALSLCGVAGCEVMKAGDRVATVSGPLSLQVGASVVTAVAPGRFVLTATPYDWWQNGGSNTAGSLTITVVPVF